MNKSLILQEPSEHQPSEFLCHLSHIAVFKNNSARPTKQGDLHSFFCADSENQVFDTRFSVRKNFFWPCGAIFWPNFYFD